MEAWNRLIACALRPRRPTATSAPVCIVLREIRVDSRMCRLQRIPS
jgi:hypothetical protein